MTEYTLIYANPTDDLGKVLLISKLKPEWQKDRFNLLGGHVETNESILDCAIRELKEESGLSPMDKDKCRVMGRILCDQDTIWCCEIPVDTGDPIQPREGETEVCGWHHWNKVKDDPKLIPNLKVIIPLCMAGVEGWALDYDAYGSGNGFGVIL